MKENGIALITGATAGIGQATAIKLASMGYNLILTGRRFERLKALKVQLEAIGNKILILCFDIRNWGEVQAAIDNIPDSWKKINVLINNAGLAAGLSKIQDGSVDDWDQMIDTNVKGLLYVSRMVLPLMIVNGSGHVINIGSIAGKEVYDGGNIYCGTKYMVDALSKSMRRELIEQNIKVTAIHPGAIETEFSLVRFKGDTKKAAKVYEGFENLIAEDIAESIEFVLNRPARVNINELIIMPKAQPAAGVIIKNKNL
jgi:NADP-dependent 3-hydroxy acid dehydrogenase YdfG